MVKIMVQPLKEVNGITFGMKRETVHNILGSSIREFKKSRFSKNMTDDYGYCHVFYDCNDECEAIEIFEDAEVIMNGRVLFPGNNLEVVQNEISDLEEESGSFISKSLSIGIYAPYGRMESILFGRSGYYER